MIFLIDMDGPLADFNGMFFQRCADNGYELDCTIAEQQYKFATDHIKDRKIREQARAMVYEPGWFLELPVVPGAVDGLNRLTEHGEVWICTKPLEANPTCRDDKAKWVVKHLGERWERRLIITPDKSLVHGHVLLDDGPHPRWYDRAYWHPVIYRAPFNGKDSEWEADDHWSWEEPVGDLITMTAKGSGWLSASK